MAPDHRKQIDNLKKFSVDFRVSIHLSNTEMQKILHDEIHFYEAPLKILCVLPLTRLFIFHLPVAV